MECKSWYAFADVRPPRPDFLHVCGTVTVGNPGIEPLLVEANPQGINPQILVLDLYEVQLPGVWPQVQTKKTVRFDKIIEEGDPDYKQVSIRQNGTQIALIDIEKAH